MRTINNVEYGIPHERPFGVSPHGISNSRKAQTRVLLVLPGTFGVVGGLVVAIVVIGVVVVGVVVVVGGAVVARRDVISLCISLMIFNSSRICPFAPTFLRRGKEKWMRTGENKIK